MSIIYRGPPYYEGTPTSTPWNSGIGTNLTGYQIDSNFYWCASAIEALQAATTASISSFEIINGSLYITLEDHTVFDAGVLPTVEWIAVGEWTANTALSVNDEFYYSGAAYVTLQPYPGAPTFDPHAQNGSAQNYFSPPIIVVPETDIVYAESSPLNNGQVLTWSSDLDAYTNETPPPVPPAPHTVTLTSSQIENAAATPITILAAPGSGLMYVNISTLYSLDFGTTPYGGSGSAAGLFYNSNVDYPADAGDGSVPTESVSTVCQSFGEGEAGNVLQPTDAVENQPITYCNFGTSYSGGDSTLKITVSYDIVPV